MRTSLILDEASRQAAQELAHRYGCSTSEAIRRAVRRQRELECGVSAATRQKRRRALDRLVDLFDGNDADEEISRIKEQDEFF